MELLLAEGNIHPNVSDERDKPSPLLWAAKSGYEGVLKPPLARGDLEPNITDQGGLTVLLWAALNEHVAVLKLLLAHEDVKPRKRQERPNPILEGCPCRE